MVSQYIMHAAIIIISHKNFTVSQFGYSLSKPVYNCSLSNNVSTCHNHTSTSHESDLAVVCRTSSDPLSNTQCAGKLFKFWFISGLYIIIIIIMPMHAAIYCTENQQGHYRVENGTVLVCVDQSWETVQNTNQLLTEVVCSHQEYIDQLVAEALATQCPTTRPKTEAPAPTECTEMVQEYIDQLVADALPTQCPTTPPNTEAPVPTTTTEEQSTSYSETSTALIALLAIALLATTVGWMLTCVVVWRKSHTESKQR